jgi:tRNA G26 N,N-dimethylase Trm1
MAKQSVILMRAKRKRREEAEEKHKSLSTRMVMRYCAQCETESAYPAHWENCDFCGYTLFKAKR